jgi:hypothetical protein
LKLAEQSLLFFAIPRGSAKVDWGTEQQKAFDDLTLNTCQHCQVQNRGSLSSNMSRPRTQHSAELWSLRKKTMHNDRTVKQQFPVYFVSDVLTRSKKFYSEMEKICYVVIMSARKL